MSHHEIHKTHRVGWLRAAVLGANDGIVSTSSLIIGVAAASSSYENIILAGLSGLVAGAMSMAAGEYVSVSSQLDTQNADLELERKALEEHFEVEIEELAQIYQSRGLKPDLAREVAEQLMEHDALGAHARDEIGISEVITTNPTQAAFSSAGAFTVGASLPLLTVSLISGPFLIIIVGLASLIFLATLGGISSYAGGASIIKGIARVTFWGISAMSFTALIGYVFALS